MLTESGVVIQEPNGTLRAVSPEEAKKYIESMPPERRKLYESVPGKIGLIKEKKNAQAIEALIWTAIMTYWVRM